MMDKPRPPHIVSEQIRDLDDVIAATREMLVRYPDDYSLRLGLNQDEAMKAVLLDELEESLAVYHHHSVQYIFKSEKNAIDLNILLTGLQTFKDLVDKTFELICKREVNLKFETVFSGSFGILLSTPYDEALINTDYEMGFKAVFNTLNRINNDDVDIHEIVKHDMKGNRKLIRKYTRFFDSVIMSNKPVELKWNDFHNDTRNVTIQLEMAMKLRDVLKEHEKAEPEILEYQGYVKGISLLNNKLEFQRNTEKKKSILKAKFDSSLTDDVKKAFDCLSIAEFKLENELNEVTEEEIKRWELLKITPIG